jgi:hypothetical protein
MTLDSRSLTQKFAELWAKELQASQAARDAEEREASETERCVGSSNTSFDVTPASTPRVVTRAQRHAIAPGGAASFEASNQDRHQVSGIVVNTPSTSMPAIKAPRVFRLPAATPRPVAGEDGAAASETSPGSSRRARRVRRASSVRAPSPPRIIVAAPRASMESPADRQALILRLEALEPLQRLAALLSGSRGGHGATSSLTEEQTHELIDGAWRQCDQTQLHQLHPLGYWTAAGMSVVPAGLSAPGPSALRIRRVSLVGLLTSSGRLEAMVSSPELVAPFLEAAEVESGGSTEVLCAMSFALRLGCEASLGWLARQGQQTDRRPRHHESTLTRDLAGAIEAWSAQGHPAAPARLRLTATMLKQGALIDREHLLLLAPARVKASELVPIGGIDVWDELARETHGADPHGLAALQLMISAAKFRYDMTPRRGGVNPMAHYVAGDQARAVEVFLQSGFDPLLPGEHGRTPRDHGARTGAMRALAEIDLHLVKRRMDELRRGAEQLREIDDLLGLDVHRHHARRGPDGFPAVEAALRER